MAEGEVWEFPMGQPSMRHVEVHSPPSKRWQLRGYKNGTGPPLDWDVGGNSDWRGSDGRRSELCSDMPNGRAERCSAHRRVQRCRRRSERCSDLLIGRAERCSAFRAGRVAQLGHDPVFDHEHWGKPAPYLSRKHLACKQVPPTSNEGAANGSCHEPGSPSEVLSFVLPAPVGSFAARLGTRPDPRLELFGLLGASVSLPGEIYPGVCR